MSKVITDKKLVEELLTRGVEKIYPSRAALEKKLLSGDRIRLYCGYDPTASSLHIGNAISINKLGQFQALGHEVIFLIGDFTGLIGDPTDKKAARKKMTREEVLHNAHDFKQQASAYLRFEGDNPAKVMYNSTWNDKLNFADLIELASNFTVQQMIQRDMFQERLKEEKPIYLHEFLYPLAQGYDSVAMDVDLEIGGNDQMFNMMCGRDLLKAVKNKEKFVLTMKLLADETGKKMGKSEGNVVFLNQAPNDMYGQVMSWPDGTLTAGFELCTNVPAAEIADMAADLKKDQVNPRDLKMKLALAITTMNHGAAAAQKAQDHFISTIQKKEIPTEIETIKLPPLYFSPLNVDSLAVDSQRSLYDLLDVLVGRMFSSKSEARRVVEEGGVKINGEVLSDINRKYEITAVGLIIQKGKKSFLKITK